MKWATAPKSAPYLVWKFVSFKTNERCLYMGMPGLLGPIATQRPQPVSPLGAVRRGHGGQVCRPGSCRDRGPRLGWPAKPPPWAPGSVWAPRHSLIRARLSSASFGPRC